MDFFLVLLLIAAAALYLLPTLIGNGRGIATLGWLFFVNLIIGWTLIGWLICLIWAAVGTTKAQDDFYRSRVTPGGGVPAATDLALREAYARERARLDHLESLAEKTGNIPNAESVENPVAAAEAPYPGVPKGQSLRELRAVRTPSSPRGRG